MNSDLASDIAQAVSNAVRQVIADTVSSSGSPASPQLTSPIQVPSPNARLPIRVNAQETEYGQRDGTPRRYQLPTLFSNSGSTLVRQRVRATPVRQGTRDIMCLPFNQSDIILIPRKERRQQLASEGLFGKINIFSNYTEIEVQKEITSIFGPTFGLKDIELLSFWFLLCIPGSKRLQKANTSITFKWNGTEVLKTYRATVYVMVHEHHCQLNGVRHGITIACDNSEQDCAKTWEIITNVPQEATANIITPSQSSMTARERALLTLELEYSSDEEQFEKTEKDPSTDVLPVDQLLSEHAEKVIDETHFQSLYVRRTHILQDVKRMFVHKGFHPNYTLKVTFGGEAGVDTGGLKKEFLDALLYQMPDWNVFQGQPGCFNLSSDYSLLLQDQPYAAGVAVALILCQGGFAVPLFSASFIKHIAGENHFTIDDVTDDKIKSLLFSIKNETDVEDQELLKTLQNEIEFWQEIDSTNKEKFIAQVSRYACSVKNGAHIRRFCDGLQTLNVVDLIRDNLETMVTVLCGACYRRPDINANTVFELFEVCYSEGGSNRRSHEEEAVHHLLLFLMSCCCSNGIHNTDMEGTCCLMDFLQFVTGSRTFSLFGNLKPKLLFGYQALPTVSVCTVTLTLPLGLREVEFNSKMLESIIGSPDFGVV